MDVPSELVVFGNINSKLLNASAHQQIKPNTKPLGRCAALPEIDIKTDLDVPQTNESLDTTTAYPTAYYRMTSSTPASLPKIQILIFNELKT